MSNTAIEGGSAPAAPAVEATPSNPLSWITQSDRHFSSQKIGEIIVKLGFATRATVEYAIAYGKQSGMTTGQALLVKGHVSSDQLAQAVAARYGLDYVDLRSFQINDDATRLVRLDICRKYKAVPIEFVNDTTVLVAMSDPTNVRAIDDLSIMIGKEVRAALSPEEEIDTLLARMGGAPDRFAFDQPQDTAVIVDEPIIEIQPKINVATEEAPAVKLVDTIIKAAIGMNASDIHFDAAEAAIEVRYRVDGVTRPATTVPKHLVAGVISRVKILADMDISEKRLPQDGRITTDLAGMRVNLRVVTLPTSFGESAVIRVLSDAKMKTIDDLDLSGYNRAQVERALGQTHGAIFVTGPTGSGKSTTLYAGLQAIDAREKSIITIEDPVEYQLRGTKQIQVNQKAGLGFAIGLRSVMRADPDVIMVGEVRDRETAQAAIEAALTGHLVMTTLHTNDAPSAVSRLVDMGIEPFLVADAVSCVIAQRLARKLCTHCKMPVTLTPAALADNGFESDKPVEAFEAKGCGRCGGTGYKGRLSIHEVMTVTEDLRKLIVNNESSDEIGAAAREAGMRTLRSDGLEKVKLGRTSISEVARVTGSN